MVAYLYLPLPESIFATSTTMSSSANNCNSVAQPLTYLPLDAPWSSTMPAFITVSNCLSTLLAFLII